MQRNQLALIIGGIVLFAFIIAAIIGATGKPDAQAPSPQQVQAEQEKAHEQQVVETKRLLAMDVSDPAHVGNVKFIQAGLERYFNDHRVYPKKLEDMVPQYLRILPQFETGKNYLYAYNPADKLSAYHLGAALGGRNPSDVKSFAEDSDFNSKKAGWQGGFSGTDPVYDLVSPKK